MDLSHLACLKLPHEKQRWAVSTLAPRLLCESYPPFVRERATANWEADSLLAALRDFAGAETYACLRVYKVLMNGEFRSSIVETEAGVGPGGGPAAAGSTEGRGAPAPGAPGAASETRAGVIDAGLTDADAAAPSPSSVLGDEPLPMEFADDVGAVDPHPSGSDGPAPPNSGQGPSVVPGPGR